MFSRKTGNPFTILLSRAVVSTIIFFGAYNPSGKSVFHFVKNSADRTDAWVVMAAIVAILAVVVIVSATVLALGWIGRICVVVFIAALTYLALQEGWISINSSESLQYFALLMAGLTGGIGLSGAIIWRRVTGQVATHEADGIAE